MQCAECDGGSLAECPCCEPVAPTVRVSALKKQPISRYFTKHGAKGPSVVTAAEARRATSLGMRKIDFHQHCTMGDEEGLRQLLRANSSTSIDAAVLLALRSPDGGVDEAIQANDWVLSSASRHPCLLPFVTVVEDDPNAPEMLASAISRGARGVKLIGWAERFIRQHDYDMRSPPMMAVYALASSHGLPVLAHVSLGSTATRHDYMADLDAILTAHPTLVIILAHLGLGFDAVRLPRLHGARLGVEVGPSPSARSAANVPCSTLRSSRPAARPSHHAAH